MANESIDALIDRLQHLGSLAGSLAFVLDYQASPASLVERASAARAVAEAIAAISRSCVENVEEMAGELNSLPMSL